MWSWDVVCCGGYDGWGWDDVRLDSWIWVGKSWYGVVGVGIRGEKLGWVRSWRGDGWG